MGLFSKKKDGGKKKGGAGGAGAAGVTEVGSFDEMKKALLAVIEAHDGCSEDAGDELAFEMGKDGSYEQEEEFTVKWEWDEDMRKITVDDNGASTSVIALVESKLDSDSDDIF